MKALDRIAIVDDNEDDRYLVQRAIKKAGLTVRVEEYRDAMSFLEALKQRAADGGPPERGLVLLDINMPRMTGFELLDAIAQNEALLNVLRGTTAVMMFTSSSNARDIARAEAQPLVHGYVCKPVDAERLNELVQDLDWAAVDG